MDSLQWVECRLNATLGSDLSESTLITLRPLGCDAESAFADSSQAPTRSARRDDRNLSSACKHTPKCGTREQTYVVYVSPSSTFYPPVVTGALTLPALV